MKQCMTGLLLVFLVAVAGCGERVEKTRILYCTGSYRPYTEPSLVTVGDIRNLLTILFPGEPVNVHVFGQTDKDGKPKELSCSARVGGWGNNSLEFTATSLENLLENIQGRFPLKPISRPWFYYDTKINKFILIKE